MHPKHVAIIGCGFTGTSAFFQLVDRAPVREISVFEASGEFGPGYPYQVDECPDYLINNTADTMCLVPDNRRAFVAWLENRRGVGTDFDPKGHFPRALFGEFLKDAFATTRTVAAIKGIKVNLIPFEATSVAEDNDGRVRVGWRGNEMLVDAAILSTGRCPDRDVVRHSSGSAAATYIATHIMSSELDDLAADATVHVLGTSLSAYDVVNRLFSSDTGCEFVRADNGDLKFVSGGNGRRVVLCSRSGRLKAIQSSLPAAVDRRKFTLENLRRASEPSGMTLAAVGDLIRAEADERGAAIAWDDVLCPYRRCTTQSDVNEKAGGLLDEAIRSAAGPGHANFLVDLYADAMIDVWDAFAERLLTSKDEVAYRRTFETTVLSYAAPCPASTGEKLLALHRAGRLSVIAGVTGTGLLSDGSAFEIEHQHGSEIATVLVNATGATNRDVTSPEQSPLTRSLVENGLLQPYRRDGVEAPGAAVEMSSFRAAGARNVYVANMFLWGPGFYTSSAMMMATIVERIVGSLYQASNNDH